MCMSCVSSFCPQGPHSATLDTALAPEADWQLFPTQGSQVEGPRARVGKEESKAEIPISLRQK